VEPDLIAATALAHHEPPVVAGAHGSDRDERPVGKLGPVDRDQVRRQVLRVAGDREQLHEAEHATAVAGHERPVLLRQHHTQPPFGLVELTGAGGTTLDQREVHRRRFPVQRFGQGGELGEIHGGSVNALPGAGCRRTVGS
jgi:hypothetical protein